jgi:TonB family protein
MKKSALILANWQYEDPLLRALVSPSKDAEALAGVLGDAGIGGFDVQMLTNEPSYRVCEETEAFFGDRNRDDLLLFYFSGHGVTDDDGQLYYAARNTLHKRLRSTAVSASWVNDVMNQCRSRRQVMLLDCCHSGAFARTKSGGTANTGKYFLGSSPEEGRGKFILTACDAFQYSFEGDKVDGVGANSVFTGALIEGLRTGQADLDGDGLITLDELYDYVFRCVRERTPQQTPRKWASDVEGAVVIAANPSPVESPLPEDLQTAIDSFVPDVREKAIPRLDKLLHGKHRGMAITAHKVLLTLANDDSRRVSTAAERCLAAYREALASGQLVGERTQPGLTPAPERAAVQQAADAGLAAEQALPEQAEAERTARGEAEAAERVAREAAERAARDAAERDRIAAEQAEVARIYREISEKSDSEESLRQAASARLANLAAEVERSTKETPEAPARTAGDQPALGHWPAERTAAEPAAQPYGAATQREERGISTSPAVSPMPAVSQPSPPGLPTPKWASPEERSAQLRAFGKALAGASQDASRTSQAPPIADTPKTRPSPKLLAGIGGGAAVLILAALAWFFWAGKGGQPASQPQQQGPQAAEASAPSQNPAAQNPPADSANPPASAPVAEESSAKPPVDEKKLETAPSSAKVPWSQVDKGVTISPEIANSLLIAKTTPAYPPIAKAQGITGIVVVEALINKQGTVDRLRVLSGPPMLISAALDAMKSWRYRPFLLNGQPVQFNTTMSFTFTLQKAN